MNAPQTSVPILNIIVIHARNNRSQKKLLNIRNAVNSDVDFLKVKGHPIKMSSISKEFLLFNPKRILESARNGPLADRRNSYISS